MYEPIEINVREFLMEFNAMYDHLYRNGDHVVGFEEAVEEFDKFQVNHHEFISEFAKFRNDLVSSDREAAAFMFTLQGMLKNAEFRFA